MATLKTIVRDAEELIAVPPQGGAADDVRGVSEERLKAGLRRLAGAVSVIAARSPQKDFLATTATAVSVVTLAPPTMLLCLNRNSTLGAVIERCGRFSINVLRIDQIDVASACAGGKSHEEREGSFRWSNADQEAPVLLDAQAAFVCERVRTIAYGTHNLVLGEVVDVKLDESAIVDPLLYLNGSFGRFEPFDASPGTS